MYLGNQLLLAPHCTAHSHVHSSIQFALCAQQPSQQDSQPTARSPKVVPVIMCAHTKEGTPFENAGPAEIHFLHSSSLLHTFIPRSFLLFLNIALKKLSQKQLEIMKCELSPTAIRRTPSFQAPTQQGPRPLRLWQIPSAHFLPGESLPPATHPPTESSLHLSGLICDIVSLAKHILRALQTIMQLIFITTLF